MDYDKTINSANETYGSVARECPNCGAGFPANAAFCSADGSKLVDTKAEIESRTIFAEKYEILEKIGSGGMGTVYKVRQTLLDKILALKITPPEVLSDQLLTRFQREAKMMAALNHPNLGHIYDFGIWANQPFIVMEYIDGVPLSTLIATNQIATEEAILFFTDVLKGLAHAHNEGVLHRDIKPSNIMIKTNFSQKRAVLLDFGIAKKIDDFSGDKELQALTRTGEMIGSPPYMSPEQARGEKLTAKSDLYSIGCSLFETLTGTAPLIGKTAVETIFLHLEHQPPSLKEATLGRTFDPALEVIIKKLLSKDSENRYESAEALLAALQNFDNTSEEAQKSPIKMVSSEKPRNFIPSENSFKPILIALSVCLCGVGVILLYQAIASVPQKEDTAAIKNRGLEELTKMAMDTEQPHRFKAIKNEQALANETKIQDRDPSSGDRLASNIRLDSALPLITETKKELAIQNKILTDRDIDLVTNNTQVTTVTLNGSTFPHEILGKLRKQVLELQLADIRLFAHDFDLINRNRNLEVLTFRNNKISANNLRRLKHLDRVSQLDMEFTSLSADEISALSIFPHLLVLNVSSNPRLDDSAVPALLALRSLIYLDVSNTSITSSGLAKLSEMQSCTTLCAKKLLLYDQSLKCFSRYKRLHTLSIARNQITGSGIKYLAPLNLQSLDLGTNPLREIAINEILNLKSLLTLKMSSTDLTREDYLRLAALPRLRQLFVKNCSGFNADDAREFMRRSPSCNEIFYGKNDYAPFKRSDL